METDKFGYYGRSQEFHSRAQWHRFVRIAAIIPARNPNCCILRMFHRRNARRLSRSSIYRTQFPK